MAAMLQGMCSNSTISITTELVVEGLRVGVVDTDIQSPGIHVLFGLEPSKMQHTLNDFLWGKCEMADAAHNLRSQLGKEVSRELFLVPSSMEAGEIARILREGYDVGLLNDGFNDLMDDLDLVWMS